MSTLFALVTCSFDIAVVTSDSKKFCTNHWSWSSLDPPSGFKKEWVSVFLSVLHIVLDPWAMSVAMRNILCTCLRAQENVLWYMCSVPASATWPFSHTPKDSPGNSWWNFCKCGGWDGFLGGGDGLVTPAQAFLRKPFLQAFKIIPNARRLLICTKVAKNPLTLQCTNEVVNECKEIDMMRMDGNQIIMNMQYPICSVSTFDDSPCRSRLPSLSPTQTWGVGSR